MKKSKRKNIFVSVKLLLIVLIIFLTNRFIFGLYIVKNNDYKNININPHDFLIYYKIKGEYQNNDIIFYNNSIYRVIGTTGQVISKKNDKVLIDNDVLNGEIKYSFDYPYTIRKDELFLYNNKYDSMIFGCINFNNISGKLIFRLQIRDF